MSDIKPGKYVIRFEPHGVGGMYATRQELPDLPVTLGAQVPDLIDRQRWAVKAGDNENQWFITSFAPISIGTSYLSTEDPAGVPAGPVIAFFLPLVKQDGGAPGPYEKLQQWFITPHEVPGVANTYTIQPVTDAVGVSYYIGVKDNELYIQTFLLDDTSPRPYWQFSPLFEPKDEAA